MDRIKDKSHVNFFGSSASSEIPLVFPHKKHSSDFFIFEKNISLGISKTLLNALSCPLKIPLKKLTDCTVRLLWLMRNGTFST